MDFNAVGGTTVQLILAQLFVVTEFSLRLMFVKIETFKAQMDVVLPARLRMVTTVLIQLQADFLDATLIVEMERS